MVYKKKEQKSDGQKSGLAKTDDVGFGICSRSLL
jgi:hypothetical protein